MTIVYDTQVKELTDLLKKYESEGRLDKMVYRGKRGDDEWIIVDFNDLSKIFGIVTLPSMIIKLTKMGYTIRQRYNQFYFKREKKQNISIEDEEQDKINEEIERLGKFKLDELSKKQLCRLLNLRKISAMRKGDTESLLIGEFADDHFTYCKLDKYEEIKMGFRLLFNDNIEMRC